MRFAARVIPVTRSPSVAAVRAGSSGRTRPAWFVPLALLAIGTGVGRAQTASMTASSTTYPDAAGQVTLSVSINYASVAAPTAIGFTIDLPTGWALVRTAGSNIPEIRPRAGDIGALEFAFTSFPGGSASFSVVVSHPAGLSGNQTIRGTGLYRSPLRNLAVPDVVFVSAASPPVVTRQPVGVSVAAGQAVTLFVEASGSPVLTYQWRKGGQAISGATNASLSLGAVAESSAGSYDVIVANSTGSVTSQPATLAVTTAVVAPAITAQPASQTALPGSAVAFSVTASGSAPLNYQWRRDGVAIPGAIDAVFILPAVYASSAGSFSVVVSNSAGSATSQPATLTVSSSPSAPVITTQPASQAVAAGGSATLQVVANGAAPLAYQWRRDGAAIAGATRETFVLTGFSAATAGSYTVVVSNSAGSVTSNAAVVSVAASGVVGASFGTFAGNAGTFALWVRADRTAVFLGLLREGSRALLNRAAEIGADGRFQFNLESAPAGGAVTGVSGVVSADGSVSGTLTGAGIAISAPARRVPGATADLAGFYAAGEPNGSAVAYSIVGAAGEAFVVVVGGAASEGGVGTAGADGALSVPAGSTSVAGSVQLQSATVVLSVQRPSGAPSSFVGANDERRTVREKLLNISTRSDTTGAEGNALIAGFVIGGTSSKRVLVRAIGPSLAQFGVSGVLPAARLEVFRDQSSLAVSNDWGAGPGSSALAAAAARLGAFALDPSSRDAGVLLELSPGAYTAVVTGQGTAGGVGLVEVYDADETSLAAQRIGNLASRGLAGSGDRTLTVGFVVGGTVPKRVLVRGIGPALTGFGVGGALADPRLEVFRDGNVLGRNDDWESGGAGPAIKAASAAVGAFPLVAGSRDAALVLNLFPGAYTAQVSGAGDLAGTALVEVYEVP